MSILALDLSTACTGWAIYNDTGELCDYDSIVPDDKLHNFEKIKYIVDTLKPNMEVVEHLVVEGIFLNTFTGGLHNVTGFELLARLSGAVINSWLQIHKTIPTLYKATEARKLVGIKGTCQKAEVQLWAIENFHVGELGGEDVLENWHCLIDAEYASLNAKEMTRPTFKLHMSKISKTIEEETGIGEDVADAVLLGRSYVEAQRINKNS